MTDRAVRRAVAITAFAAATGALVATSVFTAQASEVPHVAALAEPIVLPPP